MLWMTGYMQLLGPMVSLTIDTKPFCQSPLRCKPVLLIAVQYLFMGFTIVLFPPNALGLNILRLFHFPRSFRWFVLGQIAFFAVMYAIVVGMTRRILARYERRRLRPV